MIVKNRIEYAVQAKRFLLGVLIYIFLPLLYSLNTIKIKLMKGVRNVFS